MDSAEKYPFASIVVVVYNMADTVGACLNSIQGLDYPKNKCEVIVVDGGSTDRTADACKGLCSKLIVDTTRGRGYARNIGIAHAQGDLIAFIDADCVAAKDWLSIHAKAHEDPTVGAVGGSVVNPDIEKSSFPAILSHYDNFAEFDPKLPKKPMYHIPTCNASYKRKVLHQAKGFECTLDMYEDFMLSRAITDRNYQIIFEPAAKVTHFGITPTMTLRAYLTKEQKMGAAHFKAQTCNKYIFGRLPMEPKMVIIYAPMIMISRAVRETYKLLRVRRRAEDILALPTLLMGSFNWASAYVYYSGIYSKRQVK